ncbi:bifunctional 2-keto-4-hydroxyglutarate aldolase/2-keto-3-deoxy-6-phosphogluconate aldolase [Fundicoccus sp. Sow4_F4]|uniref:bifunctional 2-keto-4-hydroxyglutarate aldolase/2-keto-3-deoxy-6-phosphogluconate aldolase n=1 Tax=Fundicoccus sp. Sow4_F4 TaxID=3438783 RepID=UPI003F91BF57
MKKMNVLGKLIESGVIGVVRGKSRQEAVEISKALVAGGIHGIELTFTVPEAAQAIQELKAEFKDNANVVVGAGTVLDATTAKLAIEAGAEYIVSPSFDAAAAQLCNLYQIPYLPGTLTITEMTTAMKAGADIVKLFPGSAVGPSYIKAVKGPLPHANIMPTGGVSYDNLGEWIKAGAVAVGAGSNLTHPFEGATSADITETAAKFIARYRELKAVNAQ